MKIKNILIPFLFILLSVGSVSSQNTSTLYFMKDIAERNEMNPAFTPNCKFYFDFIVLPNLYLGVGTNDFAVKDFVFNKNGVTENFLSSQENIDRFYKNIRPSTRFNLNLNLNILSFGFQVKKHYFTFDLGLKADATVFMPKVLFKLVLYGTPEEYKVNSYNLKSLGGDVNLYSDIALGYTNIINEKWSVGGKVKFLMGYANFTTNVDKLTLDASRENWTLRANAHANASLPITYDRTEEGGIDTESIALQSKNELLQLLYKPAGYGAAIDLGFTYKPIKSLTLSAAITDFGFIYWNKNITNGTIDGAQNIDGFVDYSLGDTLSGEVIQERLQEIGNEILESMEISEEPKNYFSALRANFVTGIEYGVLKDKISFGLVNQLHFNHKNVYDELTLAVNFRPANWFKTSFSYSFLNGRGSNLGFGVNFLVGPFNMYLITDFIPLSWSWVESEKIENANNRLPLPYRTQYTNIQVGMALNIHQDVRDKDGDGVYGKKDKCPDTDMDLLRLQCPDAKRKELVDKHGCIYDDDKDGVHNCYDKCPDTPAGVEVDGIGCPVDTDKDSVPDYLDKCPDTPKGVKVDANGCPIDSDGDRVADYLDKCPDTPKGVEVDADGCPVDSDGDGVANYLDKCPDTPAGVKVDYNGCPVDTDGDGVADYLDKCPNTPKGIRVNNEGCPLDSDGDGINDDEDKCPDKPGPASNFGCPELKKEVRNLFKKAMNGIQFETGKDVIKKVSYPILDQIVAVMELNEEYNLTISGHTDDVGDEAKNLDLSKRRAASVRNYLINKGIDEKRLTSEGYGESKPIADNKTSKGRALNRRVEFEISYETVTYEKVENPELQNINNEDDSIK